MFSKRMVISMIVIGCLVQFMTCFTTSEKRQDQLSPNSSIKKPTANKLLQSTTKPSVDRKIGLSQPRAVSTNGGSTTGKTSPKDLSRKPTGIKKPEAVSKNENNNHIPENEESEEKKSVSGLRRIFRKLNSMRKYVCPFKLARKVYGKSKRLGSRILRAAKLKSTKNDNVWTLVPNQNNI